VRLAQAGERERERIDRRREVVEDLLPGFEGGDRDGFNLPEPGRPACALTRHVGCDRNSFTDEAREDR